LPHVWKLWVNSVASFLRCFVGMSAKQPSKGLRDRFHATSGGAEAQALAVLAISETARRSLAEPPPG